MIIPLQEQSVTAESVTAGHPDKLADQISDAVLDACLLEDSDSRVACEVLVAGDTVVVAGEITSQARFSLRSIVRGVLKRLDCNHTNYGIDGENFNLVDLIQHQLPVLAGNVSSGLANDQSVVVGYATSETRDMLPPAVVLAHSLTRRLDYVRKSGLLPFLRPDGKAQVTTINGKPSSVVLSAQHDEMVTAEQLRSELEKHVITPCLRFLGRPKMMLINPQAGRFEIGGPAGDTGLTGRKIVVDTYGSAVPHGGGAFSGKDPSKLDRSAAYMARYIAKHLAAAGGGSVLVRLAYAIGQAMPVSVDVEASETEWSLESLKEYAMSFPLSPLGIVDHLSLRRPIYQATAVNGHFGNSEFPWEVLK